MGIFFITAVAAAFNLFSTAYEPVRGGNVQPAIEIVMIESTSVQSADQPAAAGEARRMRPMEVELLAHPSDVVPVPAVLDGGSTGPIASTGAAEESR